MDLQIKIFDVDFYTTAPTPSFDVTFSDFRKSPVYQVPILRIFGATAEGKKICAHIHGVFPYFYIPYDGSENDTIMVQQISYNIDKALNISLGQSSSNVQHVYKIAIVSGIPMYGFHSKKHKFLKIYLYNPLLIKRINNLLFSETVLGKLYQPHETHIKFSLQFMIDYNLHGMSYVNLSTVKFRNDISTDDSQNSLKKISFCELECDVLADAILNRKDVERNALKNPGISALWEDERQRRINNNDDSVLSHYLSLEKTNVPQTDSHELFKLALRTRLLSTVRVEKNDELNNSVYPAECSVRHKLMNCSLIDVHSPFGSQSLEETINNSFDTTLDNTLTDHFGDITITEDVERMFEVLKSLEDDANAEDDSLLSQIVKENEENEYDLDLSLSLDLSTKDDKTILLSDRKEYVEKSDLNVTLTNPDKIDLDATIIPQMDGVSDETLKSSKLPRFKLPRLSIDKLKDPLICSKAIKTAKLSNLKRESTSGCTDLEKLVEERKRKITLLSVDGAGDSSDEELHVAIKKRKKLGYLSLPETVSSSKIKWSYKKSEERVADELEIQLRKENLDNNSKLTEKEDFIDVESAINKDTIVQDSLLKHSKNADETANLTKAEEYDLTNNYYPQAGTSKIHENDNNYINSCVDSSIPKNVQIGSPISQSNISSDESIFSDKEIYNKSISHTLNPSNYRIFYPQYKSPSQYELLQNLSDFNILKNKSIGPFCSKIEDITTNNTDVQTKTSLDKSDFESIFQGLNVYRKGMKQTISEQNKFSFNKYAYIKNETCYIKPVMKAPTLKKIKHWISENTKNSKRKEKQVDKKKKFEQTKILLRPSPDYFLDNSLDMSLTLTPMTSNTDEFILEKLSSDTENAINKDLIPPSSGTSSEITLSNNSSKTTNILNDRSCQISGCAFNDTFGFKNPIQNLQEVKAVNEHEFLKILEIELHIETRGDFRPNPELDAIKAIFYCILDDKPNPHDNSKVRKGIFAVNDNTKVKNIFEGSGITFDIILAENEVELLHKFIDFVKLNDPDVFVGYEIQMLSWGYMLERSQFLNVNLKSSLSRVQEKKQIKEFHDREFDELKITGRIILDFWRLLRHEISVQSYTFENVVYEILQRRIPKYSFRDLNFWWDHSSPVYRHLVVNYYLLRVELIVKLMEQLDLIGRTSELARLFGILFYEVLSRGSQFRVESMMLRLAKPANYVPVSPSVAQRAKMKAPEYIALVLEPESRFYTDPVIVLDFQSLYPSIVIAYNYCYSTCIGRVESLGKNTPFEFGATNLRISKQRLKKLSDKDCLNFSPCGVGFVKKNIRYGIMPKLLEEILDTRLMVKKSMKDYTQDPVLSKVLHNRQLGLKLIANVTYGYTAANFSGRMPCVELGDSIVSKARETLQRTIELVNATSEWGARVVYGDTDSLFVHCPGKTRKEAFEIGEKIVEAVGKINPDPIKLKLEKVYHPCILQTKKRYVGYMYEKPDQEFPKYEAKGIETVRRDGCPAVAKMLEKTLRILFETKDLSQVRTYVEKQFKKIFTGRISIQELTFAKEFRGFSGYKPGACVPSLELARKWCAVDKRTEPRKGERVPYCIINGPPGVPLIRLVRSPRELLNDPSLRTNAFYYVTKVIIPPLNRCFNIVGADLNIWFNQMSRKHSQYLPVVSPVKKSTISQYFTSAHCACCGIQTQTSCCDKCTSRPQETTVILTEKIKCWQQAYSICQIICFSCSQNNQLKCDSLDCPVLYRLNQTYRDMQQTDYVRELLDRNDLF